jgi:hypothetical protein
VFIGQHVAWLFTVTPDAAEGVEEKMDLVRVSNRGLCLTQHWVTRPNQIRVNRKATKFETIEIYQEHTGIPQAKVPAVHGRSIEQHQWRIRVRPARYHQRGSLGRAGYRATSHTRT